MVSSSSLKLINPISYNSLQLVPSFSCSPPSPSLEYCSVKPIGDYVIIDSNDDIDLVDIENNRLEGRVTEFYTSLGKHKWFDSLTDPYWLCLEDMPKKVM